MEYVMSAFSLFEIVAYSCAGLGLGIVILFYTLYQPVIQAINPLPRIFREAKEYIYIQTDLDKRFFNNSKVIESFIEAAKNGVIIRIFADPKGEKIENVPELKKLVDKKVVEIKVAKAPFREAKIPHFMVVDSKTVRLETYHKS
jgi:phosphatidylserine/phosphatidylglycerophosphate/cardiolipin synthase-like enzyme